MKVFVLLFVFIAGFFSNSLAHFFQWPESNIEVVVSDEMLELMYDELKTAEPSERRALMQKYYEVLFMNLSAEMKVYTNVSERQ